MMVKTSELERQALDWAVERAKGTYWSANGYFVFKNADGSTRTFERNPEWRYSHDWSQGGPIIEQNEIGIKRNAPCSAGREWEASPSITAKGAGGRYGYGPTPLIAAMRCYVASRLGEEVEIPEELL